MSVMTVNFKSELKYQQTELTALKTIISYTQVEFALGMQGWFNIKKLIEMIHHTEVIHL